MDLIPRPEWEHKALSAEDYAKIIAIARAERHKAIGAFWHALFGGLANLGRRACGLPPIRAARSQPY